jgi:hypothetical protein
MDKRTLEQLEAALNAVSQDLSPRVEELAQKSTEGLLTPEEREEYAEIVRLNDTLSLLKLQTEEFWAVRAASCRCHAPSGNWSYCARKTRVSTADCRSSYRLYPIKSTTSSGDSTGARTTRPTCASAAFDAT